MRDVHACTTDGGEDGGENSSSQMTAGPNTGLSRSKRDNIKRVYLKTHAAPYTLRLHRGIQFVNLQPFKFIKGA